MAFIPFLVIGPSAIVSLIGLIKGADKTVPTPAENWKTATLDLLIPSFNEETNIALCLDSILKQTIQPRTIYFIDDASTDQTVYYASQYAEKRGLNLHIIKHDKNIGKTPSIDQAVKLSDADVLAVVDADTVLRSENYLERLVSELYQGVGISSACGVVLPIKEHDREVAYQTEALKAFKESHPELKQSPDNTWFEKFERGLVNGYREELYLYLQRFLYHGEMVFFGSIVFPIGCACVYRREYLKHILDHYEQILGHNLTTSEDIFFGFAFATDGFRNVVVQDVYALTQEPRIYKMFSQVYKWSSSFLQSAYYFDDLFLTPFRSIRSHLRNRKQDPEIQKEIEKKRIIKEAYRQPFGDEYTKKHGRNIGWFVFTAVLEKILYPVVLLIFMILGMWKVVFLTMLIETTIYALVNAFLQKNRRIRNFFRTFLYSPVRYMQLMFDLYVMSRFMFDIWITKKRNWRK